MFARYTSTFTILVFAGAGLRASAQSISSGCQSALVGLTSDPAASTCLNAGGLINLALQTGKNNSLVDPVTTWVTGMCSAGACNNATLASIVRNVTSGCSTELATAGASTSDTDLYISTVQTAYPTARKVLCLKDTSTNNLCVNQDLNTLQSSLGEPLTINNILSSLSSLASQPNVSSSEVCTSCTKASYSILKQELPQYVTSSMEAAVQQECGADFVDGSVPSSVQFTAATGTVGASASNAASSMRLPAGVLGAAASSTLAVVVGFVFLA